MPFIRGITLLRMDNPRLTWNEPIRRHVHVDARVKAGYQSEKRALLQT
jgi:hypothetical protein